MRTRLLYARWRVQQERFWSQPDPTLLRGEPFYLGSLEGPCTSEHGPIQPQRWDTYLWKPDVSPEPFLFLRQGEQGNGGLVYQLSAVLEGLLPGSAYSLGWVQGQGGQAVPSADTLQSIEAWVGVQVLRRYRAGDPAPLVHEAGALLTLWLLERT